MKRKLLSGKLRIFKFLTGLIIANLLLVNAASAQKTWDGGAGTNNWGDANNWNPNGVPAATDAVTLINNTTVNVNVAGVAASVTFPALNANNVTLNVTTSLNVTGSITIPRSNGATKNLLAVGAGTLTAGSIDFTGSGTTVRHEMTISTGTVTVGNITADAGANGSPSVTFTAGGLVQISGTMYTNALGTLTPSTGTVEYNGAGAQTVGDFTYNNLTISNSGAKTTTGVTVTGTFSVEGTATATAAPTYSGASAALQYKTTDVRNQGPEWITPWPAATGDIFINLQGGSLTLNAAKNIANGSNLNLVSGTFAAGTNLTMATTSSITKSGGTMTGTLQGAGTYNVTYTGTSMSTSSELSGTGLRNVTLNLTVGNNLTLDVDRTMAGTLTLTSGNLVIPAGNRFTVTNTAAIGGTPFSATKNIVTQVNTSTGAKGFLRVSLPAATLRLIPVGTGSNYLPVSLTPTNANTFDVCVFTGVTADGEPNGTPFTAQQKLNVVDAVQYVNFISGTIGAGVVMTCTWPSTLEGGTFKWYPTTQHGISHYAPSAWGAYVSNGSAAQSATRNAITVFSPFNVGLTVTALPLSFTSVNAAKGNGFNTVTWQATCNSSYAIFDVERSTDGRTFTSVNTITASQQRCLQPFTYADNTNAAGTVYYRIKNTDVDGKISYSSIVKLTSSTKDMILVGVAPNPVSNIAQLSVAVAKNDRVELQVISVEGRVVQRSTVAVQAGTSIVNLDVANLQNGMYTIKGVFANGQTSTVRFMKQ